MHAAFFWHFVSVSRPREDTWVLLLHCAFVFSEGSRRWKQLGKVILEDAGWKCWAHEWLLCRYIVSQILGALIACALVYNQWKSLIDEAEAVLLSAGAEAFAATQFTPNGPPGIFAFYLLPGQTIARVFLNEFVNVSGLQEVMTKRQLTHLLILTRVPSLEL